MWSLLTLQSQNNIQCIINSMVYGPGGSMPHSQGPSNNLYCKPIPISLRSILKLSSQLRLDLPKGLYPAGVPVEILKALLSPSILAIWPTHFSLLDLITLTILGERYKLWSSSLWNLLHSPFLSLLVPNNRLGILFSNTQYLVFGNKKTEITYIIKMHWMNPNRYDRKKKYLNSIVSKIYLRKVFLKDVIWNDGHDDVYSCVELRYRGL